MTWKPGIEIKRLSDVEPYLTEGIKVKDRGEYVSVDYTFAGPDTFSNPIATECRGLKFDRSGNLIARPFQKFFNIGERQGPEDIDWSRDHVIHEKLDGSMVHGCILDGALALMTRGGISPQANMAQDRADEGVLRLAREAAEDGQTAIFEFTSPDNRIVVPYDNDSLTLLAIRENRTGEYISHLHETANAYGVQVAAAHGAVSDVDSFIAAARGLVDAEGYVIAFDDGHRLKIKGEDYAFRHKALATIASEKNVLRLILDDDLDDVIGLLPAPIADRAASLQSDVSGNIHQLAKDVQRFHADHSDKERKDYAMAVKEHLDPRLSAAAFGALDGRDPAETLRDLLRKSTGSGAKIDAMRDLFGVHWSIYDIPTHELRA